MFKLVLAELTLDESCVLCLGRVDVSRLNFVRSGKHVLAKRGMMCRYSTQMTSGFCDRE